MGNQLKCLICGDMFVDNGSKPVICGKLDCIKEASRLGWWGRDRDELRGLRLGRALRIKDEE